MGSLREWLMGPPPPVIDVGSLLGTGDAEEDVAAIIAARSGLPAPPPGLTPPPGRLLEAPTVAVIGWRKHPHLYCYDAAGHCIGVAVTRSPPPHGWHRDVALRFEDRCGPSFELATWMWRNTTLIGGQTSATVTIEGRLVGTYHQTDWGLLGDEHGNVLGVVARTELDHPSIWSTPATVLTDSHGELLAEFVCCRVSGKTSKGRRIGFLSIVRFGPGTTAETRALALTRDICDQVQHEKDMDFADRVSDWGD